MRIGCSTITFGPQDTEQAFRRIADLGFTVVDVAAVPGLFDHVHLVGQQTGEAGRVAALVHRFGFEVAGLQTVPWFPDAIDDPEELRRRYTVAADTAQAVGARVWVVDANRAEPDQPGSRAKALDRFKRTIAMAAEMAETRGLRIGIEAPHAGTLAGTLPEALELLEAADLPQLGIDLDTSHVLNSGASTPDVFDAIGRRVVHVALRDGRRGGSFCTPGDGEFDFVEFFRLLGKTDYADDVMLELEPARGDASADERAREADRARDYLRRIVAAPGMPDLNLDPAVTWKDDPE